MLVVFDQCVRRKFLDIMDSIADAALSGVGIVMINFFFVIAAEGIRRVYAGYRQNKKKNERETLG